MTELTGTGFGTRSVATPEPERHGNAYRAGDVTIALSSCGCTKSAKLGKLTQEEIIAAADKEEALAE